MEGGGGGGAKRIFLEKCSLLVDRLGRTSECYIEVEQKGGGGGAGGSSGNALVLSFCFVFLLSLLF